MSSTTPDIDVNRFDPDVIQQLGRIDLIAHAVCDGLIHGIHRSRRRGFSTEFSDFKPYVPGDDTRLLDWRIWARTDRLFVKRFEAETNLEMMLVLDATASMSWRWQDTISKLEYAANLLAALAALHIRQQDQVGLLLHDANDIHHLPPRARVQQLDHIFSILASVVPGKTESFPALIQSIVDQRRHRGRIVICSDLEEDEDGIQEALAELAGLEDEIMLFHILDDAEINLPFGDITHIEDAESGELLSVNPDALRKAHSENVRAFREHWSEKCAEWRITYLPIHTRMNYAEVIFELGELRRNQG